MTTLSKILACDHDGAGSVRREGSGFLRACWASILIHCTVIGLLVGLTLVMRNAAEEEPFVMISEVGPDGASSSAAEERIEGATGEQTTALFVAPPSVPVWVAPRETVPTEVADRPARPSPSVSLAPKTSRMTHEQYLSLNPNRVPARSGPPVARGANDASGASRVSVPRIDQGVGNAPFVSEAGKGDPMAAYFAGLVRQLADRHEKPAGLSDLLNAGVEFAVAADGAISGVRITRSSGNEAFDRSVLDAFSRVTLPRRPDGKADVKTLTFRLQET